ncbi:hypothetical protein SANA_18610 [Gottschalkiaceae bacterium SANA]|nr:hypothetical protein SANA_18610 [Gottschalkiaceae bacterium SANA]
MCEEDILDDPEYRKLFVAKRANSEMTESLVDYLKVILLQTTKE